MTNNIEIREAVENDIQTILNLYKQPDMDNKDVLPLNKAKIIYSKISAYPHYKIFVAELDNNIVGTFALAIMDNLAHMGAPSGLIEDVVVRQDLQGKGIGKDMMQYALDYCKKMKCYKVSLSSNLKRESAHKFYESLGFQKHGYSFLIEV